MAMFGERIDRRRPSSTRRACGCGSWDAATGSRRSSSSGWNGPSGRRRANDRITLFIAFNYGGRAEIVDAARTFTGDTEEEFRHHLYAPDMHDPDLLIRTSGEQRISNYLLWQCAYSELVFRDELWPDFSRAAFEASLEEFAAPRRRFGARGGARRARGLDLGARVIVAIPAALFAIFIVTQGGLVFALGLIGSRRDRPGRALHADAAHAAGRTSPASSPSRR